MFNDLYCIIRAIQAFFYACFSKGVDDLKNEYILAAASGSLGAFLASLINTVYGDHVFVVPAISLYIGIITLDWISGFSASRKDGSYASEYGIDGAFRTLFLLIAPALANLADILLGTPGTVFGFTVLAFGSHIFKSMTANVYRAGWSVWIPVKVLDWVSDEIDHKTARAKKRIQERDKYLRG